MSKIKVGLLLEYSALDTISSIVSMQISEHIEAFKDSLSFEDWLELSKANELEVETDEYIYYQEKKEKNRLERIEELESQLLKLKKKEVTKG